MKEKKSKKIESRHSDVDTRYITDRNKDHAAITSNAAYCSVHFSPADQKTITAIDYEGGPMIRVGDTFADKKVTAIQHGYILTLE